MIVTHELTLDQFLNERFLEGGLGQAHPLMCA
jgi:hypothetical protein